MNPKSSETAKRPYSKPRLNLYGDIQAITQTVSNNKAAKGDTGMPPTDKTS